MGDFQINGHCFASFWTHWVSAVHFSSLMQRVKMRALQIGWCQNRSEDGASCSVTKSDQGISQNYRDGVLQHYVTPCTQKSEWNVSRWIYFKRTHFSELIAQLTDKNTSFKLPRSLTSKWSEIPFTLSL